MRALAKSRDILLTLCVVECFVILMVGSVAAAYLWGDIPVSQMTRDPLAVIDSQLLEMRNNPDAALEQLHTIKAHWYYGLLSNVGIVIWCSTAAICFFTARIAQPTNNHPVTRRFLFFSGVITTALMLDDFFLLHEQAFPLTFGINENLVFGLYALAIAIYLAAFRRLILNTDHILLAIALALFAFSLVVDYANIWSAKAHLLEDGSKFAAIAHWFAYFERTCRLKLQSSATR